MTALSARQHRTVIVLLCIAVALCISFALSSIPRQLGMSAAHAQAVGSGSADVAPSIPDPAVAPLDALSLASKLYHSGAYLLLGIVGLFAGLRWASRHVAWFQAPNRAHYVAALLGGLALVAVPASQGATPNLSMIVIAIGTMISLSAPGVTPATKAAQAGFARLGVMLAVAALGVGLLLGACKGPTPVPVADLIDCIKLEGGADWQAVEQALKPDVDARDWGKLVADAEALGPKIGLDVAGCVAVELVQQYLSVKRADGSSWGARDAVEKLRSKLSGSNGKSVTFHTGVGNL